MKFEHSQKMLMLKEKGKCYKVIYPNRRSSTTKTNILLINLWKIFSKEIVKLKTHLQNWLYFLL